MKGRTGPTEFRSNSGDALNRGRSFVLLVFTAYFFGISLFAIGSFGIIQLPGLTVLGAALLLAPATVYAFSRRHFLRELPVLISIIIPLVVINYVYSIRTGSPVGFQDVHIHIIETQSLLTPGGFIDFGRAQKISLNFVGLYAIAWFGSAVGHVGIVALATWLPPAFSVLVAVLVYLVARRIFSPQVAVLSMIFFAWDNNTILFGHEFRTQTIGTLFTLGAVLVYLGMQQTASGKTGFSASGMLFLFALSTSSFVSDLFALTLFTVLLAMPILVPTERRIQRSSQYGLFVSFFALYVLYISATTYGSPSAVVSSIVTLVREAFSSSSSPSVEVGQQIYGPVVQVFAYSFWLVFGVFSILILTWRELGTEHMALPILGGFLATFVVGIAFSAFSVLSAGRAYAIGSVLIAIVVATGLMALSRRAKPESRRVVVAACCLVVILFVAVSIAKFPNYIVSDVSPIRGHETIDDVPYWRLSDRDSLAAEFLLAHGQGGLVRFDMPVIPYMFLGLYDQGLLQAPPAYDSQGRLLPPNLTGGELILLRAYFEGSNYAFRNELPPESTYSGFSKIYTDGDYELFETSP